MAHSLIIGMTMSGKTSLAKMLAKRYSDAGIPVAVLDPFNDPGWRADYITGDPQEFMDFVFDNQNCALFIDEGGQMIGRYNSEMEKLGTMSRHFGHRAHFLSQRAPQMPVTMRDQCEHIFLFRVSHEDAVTFAKEFAEPALKEASTLKKGEYIYLGRFGNPARLKLWSD